MVRIAPAEPADLEAIEQYLVARTDTCMFLRSNLRAVGLAWDGARYQGQYLVAWDGDRVTGLVGHGWNDMVLVQADAALDRLVNQLVRHTGRPVAGFSGPLDQVQAARAALGLAGTPATLDEDETLMALALDRLVVPPALAGGAVVVRPAISADRPTVAAWRAAYLVELNGSPPGAETDAEGAGWFDVARAEDNLWVADLDGAPVAITSFNARLPDVVQVGGVYTPPALRGRGHARAVVAGSLLDMRAAGVTRAILFTPRPDALAAYRAIGFTVIGRYGIVLLAEPAGPR